MVEEWKKSDNFLLNFLGTLLGFFTGFFKEEVDKTEEVIKTVSDVLTPKNRQEVIEQTKNLLNKTFPGKEEEITKILENPKVDEAQISALFMKLKK